MQIKYFQQSCVATWSPESNDCQKLMLAIASTEPDTYSDATSTSRQSCLSLVSVDVTDPAPDIAKQPALVIVDERVTRLDWWRLSPQTASDGGDSVVACGTEGGGVALYSPTSELACRTTRRGCHPGPVTSLGGNRLQANLLCTAGGGRLLLWDLHNPEGEPTVVSCGGGEVRALAWNPQVAHVLATVVDLPHSGGSGSGGLVVRDLRRQQPLVTLTSAACRMARMAPLCEWHPAVATQLCLASDDDREPLVQLWDLRFAASPVNQLNEHSNGILSMAWNPCDPGCLLTADGDSCVLFWDPSAAAAGSPLLARARLRSRSLHRAAWCPAQPAVFSAATSDGQLCIFHLLGGGSGDDDDTGDTDGQALEQDGRRAHDESRTLSAAASVINGAAFNDPFSEIRQPAGPIRVWYNPARPPAWMLRQKSHQPQSHRSPLGARFGFGGRLVVFGVGGLQEVRLLQAPAMEPTLARRAAELEAALADGGDDLGAFCGARAASLDDTTAADERLLWRFLEANFSVEPRGEFLRLLGFGEVDDVAEPDGGADIEQLLSRSLVSGRLETAIDLCTGSGRLAEALLLAAAGSSLEDGDDRLYATTRTRVLTQLHAADEKDTVSRLVRAVVVRDCVGYVDSDGGDDWRHRLAFALAYADADSVTGLAEGVGRQLEEAGESAASAAAALCYACAGSWKRLLAVRLRHLSSSGGESQELLRIQLSLQAAEVLRRAFGGSDHASDDNARNCDDDGRNCDDDGRSFDIDIDAVVLRYAATLASQGELGAALRCCRQRLATRNFSAKATTELSVLAHRLYWALGGDGDLPAPVNPFHSAASQGYTGPPPSGTQSYTVPPPSGTQSYTGPPPSGTQSYTIPPPSGTQGYTVPPPSGTQSYAVPPPSGTQGYAVPPPSGAQGFAVPPPSGTQGFAVPPPSGTQGFAVPPPSGTQGFAVRQHTSPYNPATYSKPSVRSPPPPATAVSSASQFSVDPTLLRGVRPTQVDSNTPVDASNQHRYQQQLYNPVAWSPKQAQMISPPQSSQPPPPPQTSTQSPMPVGLIPHRVPAAFAALVADCRLRAATATAAVGGRRRQVTVRLDDAERKVTLLEELIAAGKVSQPVLDCLTGAAACLDAVGSGGGSAALPAALGWLSRAIECGSFADMRAYMPGLKLLLQTAIDLQS